MADEAHEHTTVGAPPDRCYAVAVDFERYPEWARDVKEVTVLERDADGRGSRVEYRVAGLGQSIHYILEYDYGDAPAAFSWELAESDKLRQLDGRYGFEPEGTGYPGRLRSHDRRRDPAARPDQATGGADDHQHRAARVEEGSRTSSQLNSPIRAHQRAR